MAQHLRKKFSKEEKKELIFEKRKQFDQETLVTQMAKTATVRDMVKSLAAIKKTTIREMSETLGYKTPTNFSTFLGNNTVTLSKLSEVMAALGEEVVMITSDGQMFKIDV